MNNNKINKKILSIDVGIKNLAFCLLEINTESKDKSNISILNWDVVDLTYAETEDKNEPCKCLDKSGHVCNKIAKFNKDGISYCLKHAKKTNFILSHETPSFINKQKLDKLISISEKYKINDINIKYKKSELVSLINSHIDKNSFKSVEKKNASKIDLVTIGKNIQSNLDVLLKDEILNIQTIIIENQISPIANTMKTKIGKAHV